MCKGVNSDAPDLFRHNANAYTNCIATNEPLVARRLTHPTVGELSLNNASYAACNCENSYSITSHNIDYPGIFKSEFVMSPLQNNSFASSVQARQNTVGVHAFCSPVMMPPIP